jgi:peptide deformylase
VSVREIRLFGDPVLRTRAAEVTTFDKELRRLVNDLGDTMWEASGAGLAAPQLGVSLRVFAFLNDDDEIDHLVNPVLGPFSAELQDGEEGCLSLPGLAFELPRPERVIAVGQNFYGDPVTVEGGGIVSRCLQHETDHLDGVLFIDRLDRETKKAAMKAIREAEWAQQPAPVVRTSPHPLFGRAT